MTKIHYVEITNFKTFGEKIHIDLEHPAVLIGPNNSGKTSVIQALSLWSRGIKSYYEKRIAPQRKKSHGRISTPINRLNILEVPVAETRFLWNGARVQDPHGRIEISISVGIEFKKSIRNCQMVFTYRDLEILYCRPDSETQNDIELLTFAQGIQFHLLYPMSGIMPNVSADTEEIPLTDGRIDLLLGQGQTAQVLRNICYKVVEQDEKHKTNDWSTICNIMEKLFLIKLNKPVFIQSRGSLMLTYREQKKSIRTELDISLAGRGLQQMLLILAYIYWYKSSILMIDEPDAHLEILRQKQIYTILNTSIHTNYGQVIIATHSEAILDEALDNNLTLILHGRSVNLAKQQEIKNTLRTYGIDHYYKAKVHPRILYIEGSTDKEILKALSSHIGHEKANNVLNGKLNTYYLKNIDPEDTLDNRLDRIGGAYGDYNSHYYTLKKFIPELKAFGIFDSDNLEHQDKKIEDNIAILYWKEYEIENYFITPDVIIEYVKKQFDSENTPLFYDDNLKDFKEIINELLLAMLFNGDGNLLEEYNNASTKLKRSLLRKHKMSQFAENVFNKYSKKYSQPILLKKNEFYKLIPFCPIEEIPKEVHEKLDVLAEFLEYPDM
ncbi:MAG: AAA family ATPase [Spirochaetaceae bacterium]|nr:AAA family ATPase [Spirochaetaceae bacterium]